MLYIMTLQGLPSSSGCVANKALPSALNSMLLETPGTRPCFSSAPVLMLRTTQQYRSWGGVPALPSTKGCCKGSVIATKRWQRESFRAPRAASSCKPSSCCAKSRAAQSTPPSTTTSTLPDSSDCGYLPPPSSSCCVTASSLNSCTHSDPSPGTCAAAAAAAALAAALCCAELPLAARLPLGSWREFQHACLLCPAFRLASPLAVLRCELRQSAARRHASDADAAAAAVLR